MVRRNHAVIQHAIDGTNVDHVIVEILPAKRCHLSTFVLNVYSPPSRRKEYFDYLFAKTLKITVRSRLIIVGDFNAAHPAWGYHVSTIKGARLWETIQKHGLTMLTDPVHPTRVGNSVSRDTCPDLTIIKNTEYAEWKNTEETLGSDHYIVATQFPVSHTKKKIGATKITDWHSFRAARNGTTSPGVIYAPSYKI